MALTINIKTINAVDRLLSIAVATALLRRAKKQASPVSAIAAVYLFYRGISGHCMLSRMAAAKNREASAINIRSYFTINKPKEELYAYWRRLENLPKFMTHLISVEQQDPVRSTWVASMPGGVGEISWDAEIVKDEPNKLIGWRSVPGAVIFNAGKVEFDDAPGGQGTELVVIFSYHPPAGEIGLGIAKLLNKTFEGILANEIRGFKQIMEGSEKPANHDVQG